MPDRRLRLGLIALAIAARAAAVLVLQSHTVPRSTYEHGEIAANLLAGRGFSIRFLGADGPTSQQAPIYPWIVAGAYAIGGVGTPRALLILELGQAALGGLLVAGVLALAREVAPDRPRIGGLAGLIVALHPTLIYSATHVQVSPWAATFLVWSLALAYRTGRTGLRRDAAAAGLGLGVLALTDPILALVAPGMAWALLSRRRPPHPGPLPGGERGFRPPSPPRGEGLGVRGTTAEDRPTPGHHPSLRLGALTFATAALVVAPWIARNARVHGELVLVKSTFGYAFWQGNCSMSQGTDKVVRASVERALRSSEGGLRGWNRSLWAARHEAGYIDDVALARADYRELAAISEPERSRRLFRRALADLRAEPGRYASLCLRRLRYFVLFDETNPKTRSLVYRAGHLGLTLAAALGWLVMPPALRRRFGPTALTAALVALFHTLTIASARFHIPIEPLMALWAGAVVGGSRGRIAPQPRRPATSYASGSIGGLELVAKDSGRDAVVG